MKAIIGRSVLSGEISAPPSKSMSHRLLLLAALSKGVCKVDNLDWSQDVLAMTDCITALGAEVTRSGGTAVINGENFLKNISDDLYCRESGNTLRFMIPLCLTLGVNVRLHGSQRLMERPQGIYKKLCADCGFAYESADGYVRLCGTLKSGKYELDGSVSSQFITGMIFALLSLEGESEIKILPPFESRSYVELTLSAISRFGGKVYFKDDLTVHVEGRSLIPADVVCEGDYSNAAFLDAFNCIGGSVKVLGLSDDSAQGDKIYREYFKLLCSGAPTLDISDCPDLGPVLMAVAALKNGCKLTGTRRLAIKESDRGEAMKRELEKFGCVLEVSDNEITVPKTKLESPKEELFGYNDHRIVMALSVILTVTGGAVNGCEAVSKTYPGFFEAISSLGADVKIIKE